MLASAANSLLIISFSSFFPKRLASEVRRVCQEIYSKLSLVLGTVVSSDYSGPFLTFDLGKSRGQELDSADFYKTSWFAGERSAQF